MGERIDLLHRALRKGAIIAARLDHAVQHGRSAGLAFVGGLLTRALDTSEMSELTVALCGLAPSRTSTTTLMGAGLVRILAAAGPGQAAGDGGRDGQRKATGLRRLGYAVDAFEPASDQASRIEAAPDSIITSASYADLVSACLGEFVQRRRALLDAKVRRRDPRVG